MGHVLDLFRLDEKVSIVTGASRGLGEAMAVALAQAGSDVVLGGRERETLEPVAERIASETGRRTLVIPVDISVREQRDSIVPEVMSAFGRIDVLVNNAGGNIRMPSDEFTEEAWDEVLNLNLKSSFFLTQACGKVMIQQRQGKVINIASMTAALGIPTVPAYTASKAALAQITKLLAVEWAEYNIQVNAIGPGFFITALTERVREDQRNEWVVSRTPMNRWGLPEELAGAVVFLASEASSFVTGQILWIDGGMLAGSDWRKGR